MARIFLCHASEDKAQVREVYHRLRAIDGLEPWLDEEDLLPGQQWAREIPLALKASDFILIFLSTTSVAKRGYVQREMKLALDALQEVPEGTIFTIPVRLDACQVPEQFRPYHYANLFDPRGFERLVRAIQTELAKRAPKQDTPAPKKDALAPTKTNIIGMEFVLIPAGTFLMGTAESHLAGIAQGDTKHFDRIKNETPQHCVEITLPFYLGKYPVTQTQWHAVMGTNPSRFAGNLQHPVEQVSWEDVQAFLQALNEREGVAHYRLPTEAEWEYACRAGTTTLYSFGDDATLLGQYAWYDANAEGTTHPVGQKVPNAWGLYDMHGNVWEWVQDWYGSYPSGPVSNPRGRGAGTRRVIRGGSWGPPARYVRAAYRAAYHPDYRFDYLGFRCASSGV